MKFISTTKKLANIQLEKNKALNIFNNTLDKLTNLNEKLINIIHEESDKVAYHKNNIEYATELICSNNQIIDKLKVFLGES